VPALKYRLFPVGLERKPGNAVPIYLRLVHERNDATRRRWFQGPEKWNKLPLEGLPLQEARDFLKDHRRMLQQLELGARRQRAEWNYTLDQGSIIEILVPDAQTMRSFVPLLMLKARVEMAEGNFAAAVRTFETTFAIARHVSDGPFLITGLVGLAMASVAESNLEDFVECPGAPNLYWALTALPRPLIRLGKGEELEQRLLEMQFPDLAELDRPRPAEEWDPVLKRVRTEFDRIRRFDVEGGKKPRPLPAGTTAADPAAKSPDLPAAQQFLTRELKMPAARVKAMPPAQVLVLAMAGTFRLYSDDQFKVINLPYAQARPLLVAAQKRLQAAPDTEAVRLARLLTPRLDRILGAKNRLQRRIAALRVIEALRLHAAAHGGQLPERLSEVNAAPVPVDPGTGRAFHYERDGATAILTGQIPGEPLETTGLRYRISVRKK
jgi:hypothetical protein